jgi:hypothetical protein
MTVPTHEHASQKGLPKDAKRKDAKRRDGYPLLAKIEIKNHTCNIFIMIPDS